MIKGFPTKAKLVAVVCLLLIAFQPVAPYAQQQQQGQPKQQKAAPGAQDPGWPRQIVKDGSTLVYYQPQLDDWKDYKEVSARVAFSLTPAGGKEALGVASFQANTIVDKDSHTAYIRDIQVTSVRFPSLDQQAATQMEQLFRQMVPSGGEPISIDRLMADLEKSKAPVHAARVKNDPPQVFYSDKPAILLMVVVFNVTATTEK